MPTAAADGHDNANTAVKIAVLPTTRARASNPQRHRAAHGTARSTPTRLSPTRPTTGYTGSDSPATRSGTRREEGDRDGFRHRAQPPAGGRRGQRRDRRRYAGRASRSLANDNDPDGHALSVSAVTQPANGAAVINTDQTITYTPKAAFAGADSFAYTVCDGHGGTAQGTVAITVRNRSPVAGADSAVTDARHAGRDCGPRQRQRPDGHPLIVSAVTAPGQRHGGHGQRRHDDDLHAQRPGYTGADGFTYTVSDGRGGTAVDGRVTVRNRRPWRCRRPKHERQPERGDPGAGERQRSRWPAADDLRRRDADQRQRRRPTRTGPSSTRRRPASSAATVSPTPSATARVGPRPRRLPCR